MFRFILLGLLVVAAPAFGQTADNANVVTTCGTPNSTYTANTNRPVTVDTTGQGCMTASVNPSGATSLTKVGSTSLEASHVLKNSPGKLFSVYASNLTGGSTGNLIIYNATAAPGGGGLTGALVIDCVPFSGGAAQAVYGGLPPAAYSVGIVALISSATSCFTFTSGTLTGFISAEVQ